MNDQASSPASARLFAAPPAETDPAPAAAIGREPARIVIGGTGSHLVPVDLKRTEVTGRPTDESLGRAHITADKSAIPFDRAKPAATSGIPLRNPVAAKRRWVRGCRSHAPGLRSTSKQERPSF